MVLAMILFVSLLFVMIGILAQRSKKAVGFWTISQQIQVSDVKMYNCAVAKMWYVFAACFAVIGLPILVKPDSGWIVFTILGWMFWSIALMAVYIRIEKKYRI